MVDLEERAFRRDKRFLVRLVIGLTLGFGLGGLIAWKITTGGSGCATRVMAPMVGADAGPE